MRYDKKLCTKCMNFIGVNNFNRHFSKCDGTYTDKTNKAVYRVSHDGMDCVFCGKTCKNKNSLAQHELRCRYNPERKDFSHLSDYVCSERKGKTKENCEDIRKQCETMRKKYESGYIPPTVGRHVDFEYIYKCHNDEEIQKWILYVDGVSKAIPEYSRELIFFGRNRKPYYCVQRKKNNIKIDLKGCLMEQVYLAYILLDGKISRKNTVHHIDKNSLNNDIHNLLVFNTSDDHKRFHNSKYAWLTYDEETHFFSCVMKR